MISQTEISVPPPWDEGFEASWEAPKGARHGSLLKGQAGQYVASVEWPCRADCDAWLSGADMQAARAATTIYELRRSEAASGQAAPERPAAASTEAADARAILERALPSSRFPGQGEDPEMDEEEELMFNGGDPSFLDDSQWARFEAPKATEVLHKSASSTSFPSQDKDPEMGEMEELIFNGGDPSFLDNSRWAGREEAKMAKEALDQAIPLADFPGQGDDPEMDEEEELIFNGGDPAFLDDSQWGPKEPKTQPKKSGSGKFEWDGTVDDTAHMMD